MNVLSEILKLTPKDVCTLPGTAFQTLAARLIEIQQADRKENQLLYYKPVSKESEKVHFSTAKVIGVGGGNGSSKTDTCLAEMAMCLTGIIPNSLKDRIDRKKFRGPVQTRVVCESLTTVLHPIILPKLQWWKWSGVDSPGGDRGHWGWIPKTSLIDGSWERSWSEKLRILRVLYRNPENPDEVLGESSIQFMSVDQDPTDFASGDFHIILHDEPPSLAIWRENEARTMRVNGRMMLAMTWPDDPAIPVDWIFDEVYEKGQGPNKDPNIDWLNLFTTDNKNLDQNAIKVQYEKWGEETRKVRIFGQPIRFSNRIHPLFTDIPQAWCFKCGKVVIADDGKCSCGTEVSGFCHVESFEPSPHWPAIFVLDPHPRKPHMFAWYQIDPKDDVYQVAEGQVAGDPVEVKKYTDEVEASLGLRVVQKLIDPNMGRTPSGVKREVTWQDEFDQAGIVCDLASDSDVGRSRINEYLRPDPFTKRPRITVRTTCTNTIFQMKRYVWDDYRKAMERDLKQKPKEKYDDFPTMMKYLMNTDPRFEFLHRGAPVISRPGHRARGY